MPARMLVTLLLAAAVLSLCQCSPNPPRVIEPVNPGDPAVLQTKRTVLVAGGGLAGMSAALELAERGYNVTLVERQGFLGGRLSTKRKRVSYPAPQMDPKRYWEVEHGFHAWFHQYHNFKNVLARLDIALPDAAEENEKMPVQSVPDDLSTANPHQLVVGLQTTQQHAKQNLTARRSLFEKYTRVHFEFVQPPYKPETIASQGAYPLNLLQIVFNSPNLNVWDALMTVRALPDMIFYNHYYTVKRWSNVTFVEYCRVNGVAPAFFNVLLEPAVSVTLNKLETISAAEMLTFVHLYFISDPRAYHRYVPIRPHSKAVIDPWRRRLEHLGVRVKLNTYVRKLEFGEFGVNRAELVYKKGGDDVEDFGDANRLQVDDGDEVHEVDRAAGRLAKFDEYVIATNLPNQKYVLRNSVVVGDNGSVAGQRLQTLRNTVDELPIAPRYRILRVWYAERINSGDGSDVPNDDIGDQNEDMRPKIIETPDLDLISLIMLYHRLEDESKEWAAHTNGSVLEFHMYTFPEKWANITDERELYDLVWPRAARILPQLTSATVLGLTLGRYNNFPQYDAAVDHIRPECLFPRNVGVSNLVWAGDWLATRDYPTGLMERAVTTGRAAANAILLGDRVKQAPLTVTSSHGPGLF